MAKSLSSSITLWDFSLNVYADEKVQQSLIDLQNTRGLDVNVLFFCCWLGVTGRGRLDDPGMREADAAIDQWRTEVTRPLRAMRDHVKGSVSLWNMPGASEARKRILAAEIESERVSVAVLEGLAPARNELENETSLLADAVANLRSYLKILEVLPDETDSDNLVYLIGGCFPDSPEPHLRELLKA
jgi:uncharacterized protein (TIGR02444 family)